MLPEPAMTYLDDDRWRLDSDICVTSRGVTLCVAAGFTTDLASIPRVLWDVIAPFELSSIAPTVHDFLYQHGGRIVTRTTSGLNLTRTFTRAQSDSFLLDLMEQEDVPAWRRNPAYYAVRCFGGAAWQP